MNASRVFESLREFWWFWLGLAYLPFFWEYSIPLTGDQKVYLTTALEMHAHGVWGFPILHGEHNYFKPPFNYWVLLASWKLFGVSYASAFLTSLVALFGTALGIKRIAFLLSFKNPNVAPVLFGLSFGALTFGTTVQMEIWIAFFFVWGWVGFLTWAMRGAAWGFICAFLAAGLLAIVKGPLHLGLLIAGYWIFIIADRKFRFVLKHPAFYVGHVLAIVAGGGWYAFIYLNDFDQFYHNYYIRENIMKKGGNGVLPIELWSALATFLLPGLVFWFKKSATKAPAALLCVTLGWAIPGAVFFSAFPYRVTTYLFFLAPLACLWLSLKVNTLSTRVFVGLVFCILVPRMVCIGLGSSDLSGLRDYLKERPSELAFYNKDKFIWHEGGLLSLAVGRPFRQIITPSRASEFLKDGGSLVLSDEEFLQVKEELEQAATEAGKKMMSEDWLRYAKRVELSAEHLIEDVKAGQWSLPSLKKRVIKMVWFALEDTP